MNQELKANKSHSNSVELAQKIEEAKEHIKVGGTYVHYKSPDKPYKVIAIGLQEADEEPCVVYQAQYGDKITWVRNLNDWLAQVQYESNTMGPRFKELPAPNDTSIL